MTLPPWAHALGSFLSSYQQRPWLIGLSGGCDSLVLYQILTQLFPLKSKVVLHVNHRVQPQADRWEDFCAQQARTHGDHFISTQLCLKTASEQEARQKRYDFFYQTALSYQDPILLLGHHRDDADETALWRFLRGAPLGGVVGLHPISYFRDLEVLRPLLDVTRSQIEQYATAKNLSWVQDLSNNESCYTRNFLRHQILPRLAEKNLSAVSTSRQRLNDDLQTLLAHQHAFLQNPHQINLKSYPLQAENHHRSLIQNWLAYHQEQQPASQALKEFVAQCHHTRDKSPLLPLPSGQVLAFYRGCVLKESPLWWKTPHPQEQEITQESGLWGLWSYDGLKTKVVFRRLRKQERLPGHHRAEQYWAQLSLPPWQRPFYPLVVCDGQMVQYGLAWHHPDFAPIHFQRAWEDR